MKVMTLDYVLINEIQSLIEKENWKPGDKLPSERNLCEKFGVQRLSLRSALAILEKMEIIYSVPRSGYYVKESRIMKKVDEISSTSIEMKKNFNKSMTKIIKIQEIEIDKYLYHQMNLPLGTRLYEIKRLRIVNDKPVSVDYSFIPKVVAPQLDKYDFDNKSLYEVLEKEYHIHLCKSMQNIVVIKAEKNYADLLGVQVNDDVILQSGSVYDENDHLIEFCESYMIYNGFTYVLK